MNVYDRFEKFDKMGIKEFIEQFEKEIELKDNYDIILEDLNKKVFPFHNRDLHIKTRRHYYWLKQHNKIKFKNLNNRLKDIVQKKIS